MWELVRALRTDGVAVLLTTHLMQEAETLADHVVIIDVGKVVAQGSPEQLTAHGADRELRFRAAAGMDLRLLGNALPEGCAATEPTPGSYLIEGEIDPQVLSTVTSWCARQGSWPTTSGSRAAAWRTSSSRSPGGSCGRERRRRDLPLRPRHVPPLPGRGPLGRMLATQIRLETRLALRQGEQVLLTLIIPLALLVGLALLAVVPLPEPRVTSALATVLALGVMSTAFTSQAISLGFDRRYGVLRRLAATPVPRWLVVLGRLGGMAAVVVVQLVVLGLVALLLSWRPDAGPLGWTLLLVVLGTAAFGATGVLLGGTLRAELVLAVANIVWFVLLFAGGVLVPADQLPAALAVVVGLLPSGALADGLRDVLLGGSPTAGQIVVLLVWAVVAGGIAVRTVRWR